jgi:hypothetical protein
MSRSSLLLGHVDAAIVGAGGAQVTTAAYPPALVYGATLSLPVAQVTTAAYPPALVYGATLLLPVAQVAVAACPLTLVITRKLILSIASQAGTDPYSNPYQAGIAAYDPANGTWARLDAGAVQFSNGATVSNSLSGTLDINNAGTTAIVLNNNTNEIDIDAGTVIVNGNNITRIFGQLDPSGYPSQAAPPSPPSSPPSTP